MRSVAPLSNAERQRRFRAAHPGYNKRFKVTVREALAQIPPELAHCFPAHLLPPHLRPSAAIAEPEPTASEAEAIAYDI